MSISFHFPHQLKFVTNFQMESYLFTLPSSNIQTQDHKMSTDLGPEHDLNGFSKFYTCCIYAQLVEVVDQFA